MLDLLDYRRQVSELYAYVRKNGANQAAHVIWRDARDKIFSTHPQSALDEEQKSRFKGLRYYQYDPDFSVLAEFNREVEPIEYGGDVGDDGMIRMKRIGQVSFSLPTGSGSLSVFWIMGYGGGVFIPFGDASNKHETYGAGRYLYDSIKGADLGAVDGKLVLNFNYAYNPSCAYHYRWVCPLAQAESKVNFPIPVGEQTIEI